MARRAPPETVVLLDDPRHSVLLARALVHAGLGPVACEHRVDHVATFLARQRPRVVLVRTGAFIAQHELLPLLERTRAWCPVIVIDQDAPIRGDGIHVGDISALIARLRVILVRSAPRGDDLGPVFAAIAKAQPTLTELLRYARLAARSPSPLAITGEPGTGKRTLARAIHDVSARPGAFVIADLAGLPTEAALALLLGRRRGSSPDAPGPSAGAILAASGGTLCVQAIDGQSPMVLAMLARLADDGTYPTPGADGMRRAHLRLICTAASAEALHGEPAQRLRVHHLHLPPLRERVADLPGLCDRLLGELGEAAPTVDAHSLRLLADHPLPGNLAELRSVLLDAVVRMDGGGHLPDALAAALATRAVSGEPCRLGFPMRLPTLAQAHEQLVAEALRRCGGNQGRAARLLGVTRQALNQRLRRRSRRDEGEELPTASSG